MRFEPLNLESGKQYHLQEAARNWMIFWMISKAVGARLAALTPSPPSHLLHLTLRPGTRSPAGILTLNPAFTHWIMGWPIGWSDPLAPVTGWSRWLLLMRGELCWQNFD